MIKPGAAAADDVVTPAGTVLVYASGFLPTSETFAATMIENFRRFRPAVLCRVRLNADRFPVHGVVVHTLPRAARVVTAAMAGWGRPGRLLAAGVTEAHARLVLRRVAPALVLAHFGPSGREISRATTALRVPLAVIFHGYDATEALAGKTLREAYPGLLECVVALVAVSDFIRERLITAGAQDDRVFRHYLGIPVPPTLPARPARAMRTVVQVGRFVEVKGHATTLAAFAAISGEFPELRLRFVGDGPLRTVLEALCRELRVTEKVTFVGDIPALMVAAELDQADAFVHPSVRATSGAEEGLGLAVIEAMARALPVVVTRSGGLPEVVTEGTGLVIEPRDAEGLAAALRSLAGSAELRSRLGAAARLRVESTFDMAKNTPALERRLSELLPSRPSGRTGSTLER